MTSFFGIDLPTPLEGALRGRGRTVNLPLNSRFHRTELLQAVGLTNVEEEGSSGGVLGTLNSFFWGTWEQLDFPDDPEDVLEIVQDPSRLDLLAKKHYDDPSMWWAIADKNNIFDPLDDVASDALSEVGDAAGDLLPQGPRYGGVRVPAPRTVTSTLLNDADRVITPDSEGVAT